MLPEKRFVIGGHRRLGAEMDDRSEVPPPRGVLHYHSARPRVWIIKRLGECEHRCEAGIELSQPRDRLLETEVQELSLQEIDHRLLVRSGLLKA